MSLVLLYFFMSIGLSMDAFSLAIIYGSNGLEKKKCFVLSFFVGILHFLMPNFGNLLGKEFLLGFINYGHMITGIIFFILTLQMILTFKEQEEEKELKTYLELLVFAFAVAIDSFSVGMALSLEKQNLILGGIIFSIVSFIFTLFGLFLGKYLSMKTGTIGKIIGIIILLAFSVKYLLGL